MVVCVWESGLPGDTPDSIICPNMEEAEEVRQLINEDYNSEVKMYKLEEII